MDREYITRAKLHSEIERSELKMDCPRCETYKHIQNVQHFMSLAIRNLISRQVVHDQSKLRPPEDEIFEEYTPKLSGVTYGSEEYHAFLDEMRPAIDHHQNNNSHHPEYYEDGIQGMTLLDVVEMLCDWKAATLRHDDGDLARSIEINQERFGYSDDFKALLTNTAHDLGLFGVEAESP